jgi:hypothetical protein
MLPKVIHSKSVFAELRINPETRTSKSLCTSMNTSHPGWPTKITQRTHKDKEYENA